MSASGGLRGSVPHMCLGTGFGTLCEPTFLPAVAPRVAAPANLGRRCVIDILPPCCPPTSMTKVIVEVDDQSRCAPPAAPVTAPNADRCPGWPLESRGPADARAQLSAVRYTYTVAGGRRGVASRKPETSLQAGAGRGFSSFGLEPPQDTRTQRAACWCLGRA